MDFWFSWNFQANNSVEALKLSNEKWIIFGQWFSILIVNFFQTNKEKKKMAEKLNQNLPWNSVNLCSDSGNSASTPANWLNDEWRCLCDNKIKIIRSNRRLFRNHEWNFKQWVWPWTYQTQIKLMKYEFSFLLLFIFITVDKKSPLTPLKLSTNAFVAAADVVVAVVANELRGLVWTSPIFKASNSNGKWSVSMPSTVFNDSENAVNTISSNKINVNKIAKPLRLHVIFVSNFVISWILFARFL